MPTALFKRHHPRQQHTRESNFFVHNFTQTFISSVFFFRPFLPAVNNDDIIIRDEFPQTKRGFSYTEQKTQRIIRNTLVASGKCNYRERLLITREDAHRSYVIPDIGISYFRVPDRVCPKTKCFKSFFSRYKFRQRRDITAR